MAVMLEGEVGNGGSGGRAVSPTRPGKRMEHVLTIFEQRSGGENLTLGSSLQSQRNEEAGRQRPLGKSLRPESGQKLSPQHRIEELASTKGKFTHEAAVEGVHRRPGRAGAASAPVIAPDLCGRRPGAERGGAARGGLQSLLQQLDRSRQLVAGLFTAQAPPGLAAATTWQPSRLHHPFLHKQPSPRGPGRGEGVTFSLLLGVGTMCDPPLVT